MGQRIPLETVPTLRSDLLICILLLYKNNLWELALFPKIPFNYKGLTFNLQGVVIRG
jgi:hypothetical protein